MIPIFRPSMGQDEIDAVTEVIKSGWIGLGPKTKEFELRFAEYIGCKYAIGLNSCTSALQLALNVLGIDNGEVITSPITFVSTAHAILYNNALPIFGDIEKDTLNIKPMDIRKKVTKNTKAIIPIHYGGYPCDMNEIQDIANQNNLYIIEDAAHACGAEYKGKKAGSLSDIGCFSFHAVKNLAMGDGGAITTNHKEFYEKLLEMRWLGINKNTHQRNETDYSWFYNVGMLGYKMHMNDITAAIGLVQLKKLDKMNDTRKNIVRQYNEAFAKQKEIEIPIEKKHIKSAFHNYVIKVNPKIRNKLIAYLAKMGVSSGVHYMPLYMHSYYKRLGFSSECPIADMVWKKLISLPLYPDMKEEEISKVTDGVKGFFTK